MIHHYYYILPPKLVYTGEVELVTEDVVNVLSLANYYGVIPLKEV